ncbi:hypothetical protein [Bacillus sp. FJAT-49736]|uniref:hypothetical protein n=1 Tax=Bacillus sp. FJAT-49736 TaxID=2833582 RepID=UPI001BCA5F27|nr:hypothetical protein [Bacillus sp. FJAT-49736]MBS4172084.1 hypothetical protein [Bacillus sp. FJAT-49736]
MKFMFSASKLMKASEVKVLCKVMRENKQVLAQQELIAKTSLFNRKEKAAS